MKEKLLPTHHPPSSAPCFPFRKLESPVWFVGLFGGGKVVKGCPYVCVCVCVGGGAVIFREQQLAAEFHNVDSLVAQRELTPQMRVLLHCIISSRHPKYVLPHCLS